MTMRVGAIRKPRCRGLTLLELLVVMAILAVLLSILATTLGKVRGAARSVVCKNKLQSVAQRFQLFADDYGHTQRGRESDRLGPHRFRIEDFQDSLYATEEFFDRALIGVGSVAYAAADQPLMCPSGPRSLARASSPQPAEDTILPLANVSVGFNMRLHRASVRVQQGLFSVDVLRDVTLSARVLDRPWAPLAFDVDAPAARNRPDPVLPFWSAPPAGSNGLYARGRFWFPAARHGGMVQAAFLGGHVWSARTPEAAHDWDWAYQPPPDE
jgi:prepilin-type N-terminal cleavage/methylation domain-containing protein/prepilin-type processing-associated H-X9-DG protein